MRALLIRQEVQVWMHAPVPNALAPRPRTARLQRLSAGLYEQLAKLLDQTLHVRHVLLAWGEGGVMCCGYMDAMLWWKSRVQKV